MPENTLEAFQRAIDLGADAIETDAHMTRDGHVVLSHDATGERMAGVVWPIAESTLADVRTWNVAARFSVTSTASMASTAEVSASPVRTARIPTLEEVLSTFPDTFFNIDAKQVRPDMMPAMLGTIDRARASERVRIASFSMGNLRRARALGYRGPIGLSAVEVASLVLLPRAIARRLPIRGDAAQVPERAHGITFASPAVIGRLHELGVRVDFWTIDDPARARQLVDMGADGIVTNDPRHVHVECT